MTLKEFKAVKIGMSYDDVVYLVGGKDLGKKAYKSCEWAGNNGQNSYAILKFDGNWRVKSQSQANLK